MVSVFSNTIVTQIAERDTPTALHRDDARAELVALALVRAVVDDVVDGELPHGSTDLPTANRRQQTRSYPGLVTPVRWWDGTRWVS